MVFLVAPPAEEKTCQPSPRRPQAADRKTCWHFTFMKYPRGPRLGAGGGRQPPMPPQSADLTLWGEAVFHPGHLGPGLAGGEPDSAPQRNGRRAACGKPLAQTQVMRENPPMKRAFLLRVYIAGHRRQVMPRWLRKLLAGSELHRAWFLGFTGYFEENGTAYGLANPYPGRVSFPDLDEDPLLDLD